GGIGVDDLAEQELGADREQLSPHPVISSWDLACRLHPRLPTEYDFPTLPFLLTRPRPCGGVLWVQASNRVGVLYPPLQKGCVPLSGAAFEIARGGDRWRPDTA